MTQPIYRATEPATVEGREIVGVALPFNAVASVTDDGGRTRYLESFAPYSVNRSLEQRGKGLFPLFDWHEPMKPIALRKDAKAEPVGSVAFVKSNDESALLFRGFFSRTRKADEQLELVRDGAKRDVSIGAIPLRHVTRHTDDGPLTVRTEVALKELSLAATGYGQYPGAKVLAMRADEPEVMTDAERRANALRCRKIMDGLGISF
jgi:phage head maturation protease